MKRILLVEDNQTIQRLVSLTFDGEDAEVFCSDRGDLALERLSREDIDLVLVDVAAPGLDGYELCAAVRQNEALRQLPVVLLLGASQSSDRGRVERSGADATLSKPLDPSTLIEVVNSLISARESHSEADAKPEIAIAAPTAGAGRHIAEDFTSFLLLGASPSVPAASPAVAAGQLRENASALSRDHLSVPPASRGSNLASGAGGDAEEAFPPRPSQPPSRNLDEELDEVLPIAVFSVPAASAAAAPAGATPAHLAARSGSAILPHMTVDDIPGLRSLSVPAARVVQSKPVQAESRDRGDEYAAILADLVDQAVLRVLGQIKPELKRLVREALEEIAREGLNPRPS